MKLGKVFRKMGLPMWTFLGVGVSAIWFQYIGALVEKTLRDLIGLNENTSGWLTYIPPFSVFLLPFLVVLGAWGWQATRYTLTRMRIGGSGLPQPAGKKGLIVLVSNPNSAMFAITYHFVQKNTLKHVWLIPSNDMETEKFGPNSKSAAETIKQQCEELAKTQNRSLVVQIHETGVSPADAQDTFDYVHRVFRQSGYEPNELIADFTGGTKPMSVGMIMACLPTERELEYVPWNLQTKTMHGPFLIDYQHSAFNLVG